MSQRVLIIDDEEMVREGLKAYLEDEGLQVEIHACCQTALNEMQPGTHYDVCILDLRLPRMSGQECMQSLQGRQADLHFLVYTSASTDGLHNELNSFGIEDRYIFHKPLDDMSVLVQAIHQLSTDNHHAEAS